MTGKGSCRWSLESIPSLGTYGYCNFKPVESMLLGMFSHALISDTRTKLENSQWFVVVVHNHQIFHVLQATFSNFSSSSWCERMEPFSKRCSTDAKRKYPQEWPSAVHTFEELIGTLQREIISHCDLNGSESRRSSPASPTAYHS